MSIALQKLESIDYHCSALSIEELVEKLECIMSKVNIEKVKVKVNIENIVESEYRECS